VYAKVGAAETMNFFTETVTDLEGKRFVVQMKRDAATVTHKRTVASRAFLSNSCSELDSTAFVHPRRLSLARRFLAREPGIPTDIRKIAFRCLGGSRHGRRGGSQGKAG
jgi:hypothetical protein